MIFRPYLSEKGNKNGNATIFINSMHGQPSQIYEIPDNNLKDWIAYDISKSNNKIHQTRIFNYGFCCSSKLF